MACSHFNEMVRSWLQNQNWWWIPNWIVDALSLITFSFQKMSVNKLYSKWTTRWEKCKKMITSCCFWETISKGILTRCFVSFLQPFLISRLFFWEKWFDWLIIIRKKKSLWPYHFYIKSQGMCTCVPKKYECWYVIILRKWSEVTPKGSTMVCTCMYYIQNKNWITMSPLQISHFKSYKSSVLSYLYCELN